MANKSAVSKYLSEIGKQGAKARMVKMTAAQRKRVAKIASTAAATKRTAEAKARREDGR